MNKKEGKGELALVCLPAFNKTLQHLDASLTDYNTLPLL